MRPDRAALEALLIDRRLGRTLGLRHRAEAPRLPVGWPELDAELGGGFPRGELSELAGPRSAGRTSLLCRVLARATAHGEPVALVDALDRFDPPSAAAAGVHLARLLWVRGQPLSVEAAGAREVLARVLDRAIKAFDLVLRSGLFGVAALDLADVPRGAIARLPFITWFRLGRALEGGRTVGLLLVPDRLARSAGGVSVVLGTPRRALGWTGEADRARLLVEMVPRPSVIWAG
ncbi:MAG TPA: hypothetical protein VNI83_08575 [Vicinamibacterales bacterium]|nr:hypothetical protein [Vicinamibacterales bacterium]